MPETQEEKTFNRINMEDHNAIITLIASTSAFHSLVNEKFDDVFDKLGEFKQEVNANIKELRNGTSKKIAEHDVDISSCKISRTRQNVTVGIGITILTGLIGLVLLHISK